MKKDKSKQAKFFCESCGKEVKQNAKVCSYCGKFFSSVRCPKCGNTGNTSEFESGCPKCGYAVHKNIAGNIKNASSMNYANVMNKNHFYVHKKNYKKNSASSDSLPIWMYVVCIITIILLVILLYSCL